jgi:hypothetical protein
MTTMNARAIGEHEFEAAPGLPEALPAGERLLWQGRPDWRALARGALFGRLLAAYFALLIGWRVLSALADGASAPEVLRTAAVGVLPALLALGLVALLAWLIARTATYTITDRRVVMSIGVVLSVSFNLPLSQIAGAELRLARDGSGDIALELSQAQRIAWFHLWPHVRPWTMRRTRPALRALPDAAAVGVLLTEAARAAAARGRP